MVSRVRSIDTPMELLKGDKTFLHFAVQDSASQNEVSEMLDELGFKHENEVPLINGIKTFLALDMACTKRKIAIEFDGLTHYLREVGTGKGLNIENGPTKAKRRLLERLGWKVVKISFHEWISVTRIGKAETRHFLQKKLETAGVVW